VATTSYGGRRGGKLWQHYLEGNGHGEVTPLSTIVTPQSRVIHVVAGLGWYQFFSDLFTN